MKKINSDRVLKGLTDGAAALFPKELLKVLERLKNYGEPRDLREYLRLRRIYR